MDKTNTRKTKKLKNTKVCLELDAQHLPVIIAALETYSRLQSGQVSMAMDAVYADRNLSWDERKHIENTIRYMAFPSSPRREYDGHGGFYDQYQNEYDENGNIVKEGEDWTSKKNRPHLEYPNSYFGVGCPEMKSGTIAWEVKKAIEEYLHYERNDGYRDMGVDGDGVLNVSGVPNAKILIMETRDYWKPQKNFKIPQQYQQKIASFIEIKDYKRVWETVETAFKNKPLPLGSCYKIEEITGKYHVIVEKPHKPHESKTTN
jgi:hypothetical protein